MINDFRLKCKRKEQYEKERIEKRKEELSLDEKEKKKIELEELESRIRNIEDDIRRGIKGSVISNKLNILKQQAKQLEDELK